MRKAEQFSSTDNVLNSVEYLVDGENRRIGTKLNGAVTQRLLYLDNLRPVASLDQNGNIDSIFIYASKSNSPDVIIKQGINYRIVSDHLGSPLYVVNASTGEVVQEMTYDVWGKVLTDTNPGFQPFGFAGGLYDRVTGLVRFGARDYDPASGRWTDKDPIRFGGGQTNFYVYSGNDPINFVDPSGLSDVTYDRNSGTVTITDKNGKVVGTYPASNNAQTGSRGRIAPGIYGYNGNVTHPGDAPNSPFGSNGNFVFKVPGCIGCGVHSGRANSTDLAGRSGVNFATNGCIRTTDDATGALNSLTKNGDPLKTLIVK